jgi:hypothetical protein
MDEQQVRTELDQFRGELIRLFQGQGEIISGALTSIAGKTATPETIEVELRRLAYGAIHAEACVRGARRPSGIVPHLIPMPGEKPQEGQHPLAGFAPTFVVGTVPEGTYTIGDVTTLDQATQEIQKSSSDEQHDEPSGESTTESAEPSTPVDSPTIEASGNASDSPAPEPAS